MPQTQTAKSHASNDLAFLASGLLLVFNFALAVVYTLRQWPMHSRSHLWWIVMSVVAIVLALRIRRYATKNQDRIIRLEERLRYAALLSAPDLARAQSLTIPQIVALRFASDAELPALMNRATQENLSAKQIKESISIWRPDHQRV